MLCIDTPKQYQRPELMGGKPFYSSHLISDQPGQKGHDELVAFAMSLGLRNYWIQKEGTFQEHFDVMNSVYYKAVAKGARKLKPIELMAVMCAKQKAR